MSKGNYKLSPQLIDAMIENDYNLENKQVATFFDKDQHQTPDDIIHKKLNELESAISDPLKKIHSVWLARSAKNCYQEKHISDDFTNLEQIKFCKEKIKDNLLGSFYSEVEKRRSHDAYDFQN
mmetsp:Transcript_8761/g.9936  ORF Transcript_8761/g.9936 Transcript_8761/m.9936 type:complete len:123 (+) Transcript_8761:31-399(+)